MATWSGPTWSGPSWSGPDSAEPEVPFGDPVNPGPIVIHLGVTGPTSLQDNTVPPPIMPGPIIIHLTTPGPQPPVSIEDKQPIRPGPIIIHCSAPGPMIPPPVVVPIDPPTDRPVPADSTPLMTVDGLGQDAVDAECTPSWNDVGAGSVVTDGPVASDTIIGFNPGGARLFTGFAGGIRDVKVDTGEEAAQLVTTEVVGLLDEWRDTIVLPDFGAQDVSRIGKPAQDTRIFDWTSTGVPATYVSGGSNSEDPIKAALKTLHAKQFPDPWPDPTALWMWSEAAGPDGWRHFRVPTGPSSPTSQLWCCAYDYAEVWMDGVPILECSQAGQPEFKTIDTSYHFHLIAIRAFGNAHGGVMCSLMPTGLGGTGLLGDPVMNTRSGWEVIGRSDKLVFSVGRILARLMREARIRQTTAGAWSLTCSETADSAHRPWPELTEPITLEVGMTYLDVLNRLAETHIDYAAAPAGRVLNVWQKGLGTGRSVPTPWTDVGDNRTMLTKDVQTVSRR